MYSIHHRFTAILHVYLGLLLTLKGLQQMF